nr:MAG TPA: hypothetical protein [Caudoviricetes sp.]
MNGTRQKTSCHYMICLFWLLVNVVKNTQKPSCSSWR